MIAARFTTSWDDGHPLDLRVAEVLSRHGVQGTFYVPGANVEGRDVMTASQLRELAGGFEIGSHTRDHVRLVGLAPDAVRMQIGEGKTALENVLGREVAGFCYPGGVHDASIRASTKAAGFRYARTITNLATDSPDPFQLATTLQLYPHTRRTYIANFLRRGAWRQRSRLLAVAVRATDLEATLAHVLDAVIERGGTFHLWGHSWELEQQGLWDVLDRFLRRVRERLPAERCVTNVSVAANP